jgi:hypothetical protein
LQPGLTSPLSDFLFFLHYYGATSILATAVLFFEFHPTDVVLE